MTTLSSARAREDGDGARADASDDDDDDDDDDDATRDGARGDARAGRRRRAKGGFGATTRARTLRGERRGGRERGEEDQSE